MIYEPELQSKFGSKQPGHKHVQRIIGWTTEGPLRVLMGCTDCTRTVTVAPSRRITKIPDGFTLTAWAKLLDKADARAAA